MSAIIIDFYAAALRLRNKDLRKAAPGIKVQTAADLEREQQIRVLEEWRRGQPKPKLFDKAWLDVKWKEMFPEKEKPLTYMGAPIIWDNNPGRIDHTKLPDGSTRYDWIAPKKPEIWQSYETDKPGPEIDFLLPPELKPK